MGAGAHKSFRLPESRKHYAPRLDYHTVHTKIELTLDFERKSISGACTLEIEPKRPDLREVRLDACEMDISGVNVDGAPSDFEYDNSTLVVALKSGGGRRIVRVEYSATPREGLYFTAPDAEFPDKEVQAWTHTEAEASRFWFPCHDHPADKSTSETIIRVPKEFRVISNGRLISSNVDGDKAAYHWVEDVPHSTYLTSFVAGKFGVIEQEVDGIELRYNFPESKRADVLRYFGETPSIIRVLGELAGMKYPYEKYDQTTVQDFIFGGEENINATTLAMSYYPDKASEEDFQTTYSTPHTNHVNLVAHEASHQWFGDYVTCSDWAHAWLNEGFATYFQFLYVEKTKGIDEARWDLSSRVQDYFDEDETEYRRPIVEREYVWPDDLFDSHLYPKAASMLHELRFLMGDEAFFKGVSHYLSKHARSSTDTHDFMRALIESSGIPLEEFFEQAFFKPGHPEFEASYAWDGASRNATVRVRQVQKTDDGTPVFKLPCDIVFYVQGERRPFRVQLDSPDQTLTFSLPAKPSVVEFDPQRWLLKKLKFEKSLDLLLSQLAQSQDAWSRSEAARDLGKLKSSKSVAGLREAAAKEQFWHVRASAIGALGEIGTDDALKALFEVGVPKNRRIRRALAESLGNFKTEKARKWLVGFLENDESPYVRCEAALALAKAWPEGALAHLRAAMKVRSPNETLAEACLDAMGKLKDAEVNQVIMESLRYGKPTRERIGALKAIKGRGQIVEGEVPVLKDIILHDKEFRVRLQAVNQLVRPLSDKRFVEEVREASRSDRDSRVRRKALETFYELGASAEFSTLVAKLRAEVEELKDENKRLARAAA